jgi:hypothetical protein
LPPPVGSVAGWPSDCVARARRRADGLESDTIEEAFATADSAIERSQSAPMLRPPRTTARADNQDAPWGSGFAVCPGAFLPRGSGFVLCGRTLRRRPAESERGVSHGNNKGQSLTLASRCEPSPPESPARTTSRPPGADRTERSGRPSSTAWEWHRSDGCAVSGRPAVPTSERRILQR